MESNNKINMNNKHAYLLMLHHRKDLVDLLIEELDHPLNDLFIHIDIKSKELSYSDIKTKHSNVYFVEQISVNWGGYSQIRCEFLLMKKAYENGPYAYYHLVQGSSFPLKTQDNIHQFFIDNAGKNYIEYSNESLYERVAYIRLFNEHLKRRNKIENLMFWVGHYFQEIQRIFNYDHFKKYNLEYRKGFALWSLTNEAIKYLIDNERLIYKIFKYTVCPDEIAIHTILYNSDFKETIDIDKGCLWLSTWTLENKGNKRLGHNFVYEDLNYILKSNALFARKFEGEDGLKLINAIKKQLHG